MDHAEITKKLDELSEQLKKVKPADQPKLGSLISKANKSQQQLRQSLDRLEESLDSLRLIIKYQMFDLEATRRENSILREMLEQKRPNDF